MSDAPVATCMVALMIACNPDPHRRSSCRPPTDTGNPASSATTRPSAGASIDG
jgi:hypothetical protein